MRKKICPSDVMMGMEKGIKEEESPELEAVSDQTAW